MGITAELLKAIDEYIDANYVVKINAAAPKCIEESTGVVDGADLFVEECVILEPLEHNEPKRRSIFGEKRSKNKKAVAEISAGAARPVMASRRKLDNLVNEMGETFSQKLLRLIDDRELKDSEVYNKAGIDRRHFSKIRNDVNYAPTKKTVFAFAIALELSLDESIDLLKSAGYTFSNSSKFDIIVKYFIENKEYDMILINDVLDQYGQQVLGA